MGLVGLDRHQYAAAIDGQVVGSLEPHRRLDDDFGRSTLGDAVDRLDTRYKYQCAAGINDGDNTACDYVGSFFVGNMVGNTAGWSVSERELISECTFSCSDFETFQPNFGK